MTRLTTLFTLATATLLSTELFSAPVTQHLKIVVADNSNLAVQQPTSMLLSFSSNGTDALDSYDIGNQFAIGSLDETVHAFAFTSNNDIITQEDAVPELISYKRIRFGFATKFPATIKIIAFAFGDSSDSTNRPTYAWIEQISTGYIYPILGDTVKLDIPANLSFESDFYLHTGPQITTGKTDETCYHAYDGNVSVSNPNLFSWNLKLYKNNTLILNTAVNQPDTIIPNLTDASYSVVTCVNSIPIDSTVIVIHGSDEIIADFSIDNYYPTVNDTVNFTNMSTFDLSSSISYSWTFGDTHSDTTANTSHQYSDPGSYEVVLTLTNAIGCQATVFDSVFVSNAIAPMHQGPHFNSVIDPEITSSDSTLSKPFDPSVAYTPYNQKIAITNNEQSITVLLMDMNGRLIDSMTSADSSFEMPVSKPGIYIVQMISSQGEIKSKRIMVTN